MATLTEKTKGGRMDSSTNGATTRPDTHSTDSHGADILLRYSYCDGASSHVNIPRATLRHVADRIEQLERKLAEVRSVLAGEDYTSLPSDFPTVRMAQTIRSERDKFLWQVRDTCARAEKAEVSLSALSETAPTRSYEDGLEDAAKLADLESRKDWNDDRRAMAKELAKAIRALKKADPQAMAVQGESPPAASAPDRKSDAGETGKQTVSPTAISGVYGSQPCVAAPQDGYYLASFKDGRSNGIVTWWGQNGCGYTPYLEQAGIYKKADADARASEETVAVPVSFVKGHESISVDQGHQHNQVFWKPDTLREAVRSHERSAPCVVDALREFYESVSQCMDDTTECSCGRSEPWWKDSNADYLTRDAVARIPKRTNQQ